MRCNKITRGRCRKCKVKLVISASRYVDGVKKYVYKCPMCNDTKLLKRRTRWAGQVDLKQRENHPLNINNDYKLRSVR